MLEYIPPGFYRDLSNERYHKSQGLSSSVYKMYDRLIHEEVVYELENRASSATKELGTLLHAYILERADFYKRYAVMPDGLSYPGDRIYNAKKPSQESLYKIWAWDEWQGTLRGREQIAREDHDKVLAMAKKLMSKTRAIEILDGSINESSIYWEFAGQLAKIRPDAINIERLICADVKTSDDVSDTGFQKSIDKFGYDVSAALQLRGLNQCPEIMEMTGGRKFEKFWFLCVKNTGIHRAECYELSPQYIDQGNERLDQLIAKSKVNINYEARTMYPRSFQPEEWSV